MIWRNIKVQSLCNIKNFKGFIINWKILPGHFTFSHINIEHKFENEFCLEHEQIV